MKIDKPREKNFPPETDFFRCSSGPAPGFPEFAWGSLPTAMEADQGEADQGMNAGGFDGFVHAIVGDVVGRHLRHG